MASDLLMTRKRQKKKSSSPASQNGVEGYQPSGTIIDEVLELDKDAEDEESKGKLNESVKKDLEDLLQEREGLVFENGNIEIDLQVVDDSSSGKKETPIDFSVSRQLVPVVDDSGDHRSRLSNLHETRTLTREELQNKRIVYPDMEDLSVMNDFREIRTRLLQKSNGKNFSVMVVSLKKDMGASFTSINLGAVFAYEGEKTALLINCNRRETSLNGLLDSGSYPGLSDYFANPELNLASIIHSVGIHRLKLIPYGTLTSQHLEFFGTQKMHEFVNLLKNRYVDRYLIINAPPLEESTDAAILSQLVDYVLVVVPYGRVSKSRLNKAIRSLPRAKIAGVVLNKSISYV